MSHGSLATCTTPKSRMDASVVNLNPFRLRQECGDGIVLILRFGNLFLSAALPRIPVSRPQRSSFAVAVGLIRWTPRLQLTLAFSTISSITLRSTIWFRNANPSDRTFPSAPEHFEDSGPIAVAISTDFRFELLRFGIDLFVFSDLLQNKVFAERCFRRSSEHFAASELMMQANGVAHRIRLRRNSIARRCSSR